MEHLQIMLGDKKDEDKNDIDEKSPSLTDVFVAYPTMPGYVASGGQHNGTIYMQALARCLKEKYQTHDLSAIHRMVKQVMARQPQGDDTIQTAEERNGLRYLLKFGDYKPKEDVRIIYDFLGELVYFRTRS